jgi:two-component system, OmpR family, response regulator
MPAFLPLPDHVAQEKKGPGPERSLPQSIERGGGRVGGVGVSQATHKLTRDNRGRCLRARTATLGGDDYVTKPFSLEELVARIRTVLRRTGNSGEQSSRLAFEDLQLDDETREVARGGVPIELTATEYRLLRYLLTNPRRVLTREQILNHVWDYDFAGDARVLETYVSYLRKKLDVHGPPLIHTVRGVGYALRAPRGR